MSTLVLNYEISVGVMLTNEALVKVQEGRCLPSCSAFTCIHLWMNVTYFLLFYFSPSFLLFQAVKIPSFTILTSPYLTNYLSARVPQARCCSLNIAVILPACFSDLLLRYQPPPHHHHDSPWYPGRQEDLSKGFHQPSPSSTPPPPASRLWGGPLCFFEDSSHWG